MLSVQNSFWIMVVVQFSTMRVVFDVSSVFEFSWLGNGRPVVSPKKRVGRLDSTISSVISAGAGVGAGFAGFGRLGCLLSKCWDRCNF